MDNNKPFSNPEVDKIVNSIKIGRAVHIVNMKIDEIAIIGMHLMTIEDVAEYLKEFIDMNDITPNSIMVFESRHVVEVCKILHGLVETSNNVLRNNNIDIIDEKEFINDIFTLTLSKPLFHSDFVDAISKLAKKHFMPFSNSKSLYDNIIYIINNVWYIGYGNIDKLGRNALNEFKENAPQ